MSWYLAVGLMTVSAFALGPAPAAGLSSFTRANTVLPTFNTAHVSSPRTALPAMVPREMPLPARIYEAVKLRRASSDMDVGRLIVAGIPEVGMPAQKFSSPEVTALVAYIRNMRDFDSRSMSPGDAARGQAVFEGKGACLTCHSVAGNGRRVAPDLTAIANVRSAGGLERTLLDPTANMLPHNRSIRAVTRAGDVITGRRLNEDTYTVQLIDEQERLVSFDKADLREYRSPQDIADVFVQSRADGAGTSRFARLSDDAQGSVRMITARVALLCALILLLQPIRKRRCPRPGCSMRRKNRRTGSCIRERTRAIVTAHSRKSLPPTSRISS